MISIEKSRAPAMTMTMTTPSSQFIIYSRPPPVILIVLVVLAAMAMAEAEAEGQGEGEGGCLHKCGDMDIPFPFGIGVGPGCFRDGFQVAGFSRSSSLHVRNGVGLLRVPLSRRRRSRRLPNYWSSPCTATGGGKSTRAATACWWTIHGTNSRPPTCTATRRYPKGSPRAFPLRSISPPGTLLVRRKDNRRLGTTPASAATAPVPTQHILLQLQAISASAGKVTMATHTLLKDAKTSMSASNPKCIPAQMAGSAKTGWEASYDCPCKFGMKGDGEASNPDP
ncbi:hypothetical protein ACQJBY_072605 [Aegilops geniculata]